MIGRYSHTEFLTQGRSSETVSKNWQTQKEIETSWVISTGLLSNYEVQTFSNWVLGLNTIPTAKDVFSSKEIEVDIKTYGCHALYSARLMLVTCSNPRTYINLKIIQNITHETQCAIFKIWKLIFRWSANENYSPTRAKRYFHLRHGLMFTNRQMDQTLEIDKSLDEN